MVAGGTQSRWALILAGGDGRRLRPLTRQIAGDDRPKQFCPVLGGETLLEQTRRRVAALAPSERVLVVVVRAHERFYAPLLADVPSRCVVIQPENRGTAPAILYGLLRLTAMTPVAPVALFPSDHYVSDDAAFIAHVEGATEAVRARPDLVVLLGITPDTAEVEYGWIELGDPITGLGLWTLYRVLDFWEKPAPVLGEALRARGCLWNSFVIVAYPSTLIALCRRALPSLVDEFLRIRPALTAPCESEHQTALRLPALTRLLPERFGDPAAKPRRPSCHGRRLVRLGGASASGRHARLPQCRASAARSRRPDVGVGCSVAAWPMAVGGIEYSCPAWLTRGVSPYQRKCEDERHGRHPTSYVPHGPRVRHDVPCIYSVLACPVRLDEVVPSIELLRHRLPVGALHERHVRHRVAVLQRGKDADDAIAFVLLHRFGGGRVERALGLGHRLALRLRRREVCVMRDRLCLGDLPGLVIDDHLGEVVTFHRVDGELQLAFLHLVLRRDRLAFLGARRQALLERRLDALQRLGQFRALLVVVRLRPTYRHREAPRHEKRHRGHRHLSHFLALPISHRWSCYVFCFNTV